MASDDWSELPRWRGTRIGPVELLEEVDSTSLEALRRIDTGPASSGATLVARRQTAGHGSRGRAWHDLPDRSLALTVMLRWPEPAPLALATWLGAVGVADLLRELGLPARLKWPNDALLDGRKIAGVLAEVRRAGTTASASAAPPWIALGIGLNVGHGSSDFPPDLAAPATSLALHGVALSVPEAARRLLAALDRRVDALLTGSGATIRDAYLDGLGLLGRRVRATLPGREVEGALTGLEVDGTIVVGDERLPGGHVAALRAL
jgi:BirA family biotin operon repressor/biotin-[acetyl-CoA-carboxylase] ligase